MSDEVTLKIRMPGERYLALRALANSQERSMNAQVNFLISDALVKEIAAIKGSDRGQDGGKDED